MAERIDPDTGEVLDRETTVELFGPDGKSITGPMSDAKFDDYVERVVDHFSLEPSAPGTVPRRVIDELVRFKEIANDHAQAFTDAVKAQAEKADIKPGALKRYVCALVADKLEETEAETDDLTRLIEARA